MWTTLLNVYCEKLQGKWNKTITHVLNGVCTIHTPCSEMSGSNDTTVLNQVCFQTLFAMRFQTGYYFRKGIVVQEDFDR